MTHRLDFRQQVAGGGCLGTSGLTGDHNRAIFFLTRQLYRCYV
jgi:hypothetical protein